MNPPLELDLADETIARSVLSLQREAYAVEAALIGSTGIPALTETLEARRAAGETWLGIPADDGLGGAVSWRELADGTVDIDRTRQCARPRALPASRLRPRARARGGARPLARRA